MDDETPTPDWFIEAERPEPPTRLVVVLIGLLPVALMWLSVSFVLQSGD